MRRLFISLSVLSLLIACKRDPQIMTTVYDVDYVNHSDTFIYGNLIDREFIGADNMVLFDTLLMVMSNNNDGQLNVYGINSMKHLGTFCQKGRAKNEYISANLICNQAYYKDGHVILVVADFPNKLKEVDVTASIQNGKTEVLDEKICMSMEDGEFVILDDDYANRYEFVKYIPIDRQKSKFQIKYYLYKNNKRKALSFFRSLMDSEYKNTILPYLGKLYKHPYKNIVVQSFERMDYLLYMDFDSLKYYSIHQSGSPTFGDTFIKNNDPRTALYFMDGASSPDYLMFMYRHGNYSLKECGEEPISELLVFDWDGHFIASFKLDRNLFAIEYDGLHKVLYGMDIYEKIYTYDLSLRLP